MTSLNKLPARTLRRLLDTQEINPSDLLDACIARMQATNPKVNALCATDVERAHDQAKRGMSGTGLLRGMPIGVKDLQETEGLRTTYGNLARKDFVPAKDHDLVARLRAAGAIIAAKTNTPDMGAGANTRNSVWGATGNPFNNNLSAGGSSGGSAVALALDMLPLCTGSDTGGSLRIPAAWCGVVGFRPSPGVVGCNSRQLGWSSISVLGPMARDVQDCAFFLQAMMGPCPADPLAYPIPDNAFWPLTPSDAKTLRIGFTTDFGHCATDQRIAADFMARIAHLQAQGIRVSEVSFQGEQHLGEVDRCFDVQRAVAFVAGFAELEAKGPELLGPNIRENLRIAKAMSLQDVAWAQTQHTQIARKFASLIGPAANQFDVILAPTLPVSPFPWTELFLGKVGDTPMKNYYHWLAHTYTVTLAQNPTLALPTGLDHAQMPFGIQVIGGLHQDAKLLRDCLALEEVFNEAARFRRPVPDASRLGDAVPSLTSITLTRSIDGGKN